MKKTKIISLVLVLMIFFNVTVFAHPGRLDSDGGHYVRTAGWGYKVGTYHYHQGKYAGYTVSYRGEIPKTFKNTKTSKIKKNTKAVGNDLIKKVQSKLNSLGYNCGKADGIQGSKTTIAIKKFQKDKKLVADGIIGPKTLKKLGL